MKKADLKKQIEANKRYEERNPEAKEKNKISRLKSTCKRYIKEYAEKDDIEEIENLIKERKKVIK